MQLTITSTLRFEPADLADVFLQVEVADLPEQRVLESETTLPPGISFVRVPAHDAIGNRLLLRAQGPCEIVHRARVETLRLTPPLAGLQQISPFDLPGETISYLFGSRYCQSEQFTDFASATFAGTTGGERVAAIVAWCAANLAYQPGASNASTTAIETFHAGAGVCRDYAHLVIALARASEIPARYASVYAPDVTPQDFHAIAEVFLASPDGDGGCWLAVDATGMARPEDMAKIGIGRDAADVSFLTAFGPCRFDGSEVAVTRSA
jgi:transglutaminase-like putative cysteine protease